MTAAPPEKWLTPEQAAAILPRFNADWIRAQLRTGRLAGSKVGGRWFVKESALDELLRSGSNSTARTSPSSTARRRRRRAT